MRRLWIALCLLFGAAVDAAPVGASVGNTPSYSFYYTTQGYLYKVFVSVNSGTAHTRFRAYIACNNGDGYYGAWQTQPGPWLGSTAQCPSPYTATYYGLQWG